jgi:peptide/nickel transport system substrate-binding protein
MIAMRWSAAAAALGLSVACAFAAPVPGGSLKMALRGDPGTLDCHAVSSSTVSMAVSPAYSTLLRFDPQDYTRVVGGVARSWNVSPDALTYTFKLEPDVRFHDGTPLTSEDVRATFERLRNPPPGVTSVRKNLFSDIKAIRVVDPTTIVFSLAAPDPAMLTVFANPWNCLYSAQRLAKDPNYPAKTVMGSGPFRMVEYTPGSHIVYEKFPGYFRPGLPYLDKLEFIILANAAVVPALSSGQVDADFFTFSQPLQQQIARARGDKTVFDTAAMTTMSFVAFNTRRKPFDDVRVRRALTLAIDRKGGDASLPKLIAVKGYSPIYRPGTAYSLPADRVAALPGFGADLTQARQDAKRLLQEAGATDLKLSLLAPSSHDPFEVLGVYLADAWRRIGVKVELRSVDSASYLASKRSGDFDAVIDWNSPVSTHPIEVLEKYVPGSASNTTGAQDDMLSTLYRTIKRETDEQRLVDESRAFQQRLLEQAYVAPLFWATRTTAVPADLRGWKTPPNFYLGLDHAELWREPAPAQ